MTSEDLTNLLVSYQLEHANLSQELSRKLRLGLQYDKEHTRKIYQLSLWLEILQDYVLFDVDDTSNTNYFSPEEMIELNNYMNSILDTVYSANFTLN